MDELTVSVERITFYNSENGYSVLRLLSEGSQRLPGLSRDGLVTVVGNLPELTLGQSSAARQQFNAEFCEQTLPTNAA